MIQDQIKKAHSKYEDESENDRPANRKRSLKGSESPICDRLHAGNKFNYN